MSTELNPYEIVLRKGKIRTRNRYIRKTLPIYWIGWKNEITGIHQTAVDYVVNRVNTVLMPNDPDDMLPDYIVLVIFYDPDHLQYSLTYNLSMLSDEVLQRGLLCGYLILPKKTFGMMCRRYVGIPTTVTDSSGYHITGGFYADKCDFTTELNEMTVIEPEAIYDQSLYDVYNLIKGNLIVSALNISMLTSNDNDKTD